MPNPDVVLFSAGNQGSLMGSFPNYKTHIGSTAAAKNSITVGATKSTGGALGGDILYIPPIPSVFIPPTADPTKLADFSSRGPTAERRNKPDVVAPGAAILSAASQDLKITTESPPDPFWKFSSGTSMSTPLVAGVCAVLREALLHRQKQPEPSAALVKALLTNGAEILPVLSQYEQGFGRVNMVSSLLPIEPRPGIVASFADVGTSPGTKKLKEGETWPLKIEIPAAFSKDALVKVTLVYTDRFGPAIQNKLSLHVRATKTDGKTEQPQRVDYPVDNNVEQLVLNARQLGGLSKVDVAVTADRITRLDDVQGFAVVWRVVKGVV